MWVYREDLILNPEFEYADIKDFNTVCLASKRQQLIKWIELEEEAFF